MIYSSDTSGTHCKTKKKMSVSCVDGVHSVATIAILWASPDSKHAVS